MSDIGWKFPGMGDGTREGFNIPAVDMFRGERLQSLVREMIQNSLDAHDKGPKPVEVRFTLTSVPDDESGLTELNQYLAVAADLEHSEAGKHFYRNASELIAHDDDVRVLGVHDYNTNGLTGPTYDPPSDPQSGAWLALVKGAGMTKKQSNAALGSFGHGSRAPFAVTDLRTLFYLTRIPTSDGTETRFQGKSILQSLPLNRITGEDQWTVATGYFGIRDKCQPLLNERVPDWALAARPEPEPTSPSTGTSIFIPAPHDVQEPALLWQQIQLAVVANFYYAVLTEHLVVHLGDGVTIDANSIEVVFDAITAPDIIARLEPTSRVLARLESALTVRCASLHGDLELPGFGKVQWFLRLDDLQTRVTAVARGNGMLITRRPERLLRFPGTRPFDLFVCVSGDEGSQLLRQLENPEHTEFEFDRISDPHERNLAHRAYKAFTDAIRGVINEHAAVVVQSEVSVADLDDFFRGDSGAGGATEEEIGERSGKLRIGAKYQRKHRDARPTLLPGTGAQTGGQGTSGGSGTHETSGGNLPGEGEGSATSKARNGLPVRDLRVVRNAGAPGEAMVHFTPIDHTRKNLVLLRSGDREVERLKFRTDEDIKFGAPWRTELNVGSLTPGARKALTLHFHPDDLEFAIEGRLES